MCCAAIGGSGCALSWRHTGTDGAVIMVEWHGYGRACPPGRRQIVGAVFHLADREPYRRLNDTACVCAGEVRSPGDPGQPGPDLVIDVAELVWEPIAD